MSASVATGWVLRCCMHAPAPMLAMVAHKAFGYWKVGILVNALSAMKAGGSCDKVRSSAGSFTTQAPVDLVCVRCPSDVRHRAGYSPRPPMHGELVWLVRLDACCRHNRIWMCANRFWNPFEFRRGVVAESELWLHRLLCSLAASPGARVDPCV